MNKTATHSGQFREYWLNPRRKRLWAIVFVLLYTLAGFFLAPVLIKKLVIDLFQNDLDRSAQIENVKVNPFVLSLEVQGFQVNDKDDVKLMAFDDFFVNYQLSSLFKWAFVYKEMRLDAPYLFFERFKPGDTRIEHLLADLDTAFPPDPDGSSEDSSEDQQPSAPRLMIQNLSINNGRVEARDNVPDNVVEVELTPVNIHVKALNTLPDISGQQSVEISLPGEGRLTWSGSLKLAPFHSEGELSLKNLRFDRSIAYLKSILPLQAVGGILSSQFKYRLDMDEQLGFSIKIDDLRTDIDDVVIKGLSPSAEFINIPAISLAGGKMRYPERTLMFKSLQIRQAVLSVWRNPDGTINLLDLMGGANGSEVTTQSDAASPAWSLLIDDVDVSGGQLNMDDNSVDPPLAVNLTDLKIKVTGLGNADETSMPVALAGNLTQGGSFTMKADLKVLPEVSMSAAVTSTQIPLALAQSYVKKLAHIEIIDGALNSEFKIEVPDSDTISASGRLQINKLEVNDTLANQKLVGWNKLDIDQFEYKANKLRLSQLVFAQPFAHLVINQDRSTNLSGLIIEPGNSAGAADETPLAESPAMTVIVGGVLVEQGDMAFADMSLPLPFSTRIANLNGSISTIATDSLVPAQIKLEGQVNEYGLARIDGSLNMLDPTQQADIKVDFRNLLMSELTPYTVEFAGREIDQGKLDLALVYQIKEGVLDGQNDIVLSDLVLGKKVDQPGAANLPLGLAVALLKDAEGVIQVDLPVQGDINDPEFKIGGVIWKAFANLITKLVTAPFQWLGSLIGVDSEDLGQFEFLAGRSDLTPPELEKVAQLQQALQARPELVVEISGVTDRAIDAPALKDIRLRQMASERLGEGLGDEDKQSLMLDEQIRNLVEEMFKERFPDIPIDLLQEKHKMPPADDPEGKPVLDELAYAADMWEQLLLAEIITDQDLDELASARAEAIRSAFLASSDFAEKRLVVAAPKQVTSEDGEWVLLELAVASQ